MKTCLKCSMELGDATVCKRCPPDAPSGNKSKKKGSGCVNFGLFFFGVFMVLGLISAAIDGITGKNLLEDQSTRDMDRDESISKLKTFVESNDPIEQKYTFDNEYHTGRIPVHLVEPAPAFGVLEVGPMIERNTFSSLAMENKAKEDALYVRYIYRDTEVPVYAYERNDRTDSEFALITFTDVLEKESIGWIDKKYLFDESTHAQLARDFQATPAGKLCTKYKNWSLTECQRVANKDIWIGMTYDMLLELRGKPSSASPSNYGSGTQWQWCWHGRKPMCFYDNDNDSKVDAFN